MIKYMRLPLKSILNIMLSSLYPLSKLNIHTVIFVLVIYIIDIVVSKYQAVSGCRHYMEMSV